MAALGVEYPMKTLALMILTLPLLAGDPDGFRGAIFGQAPPAGLVLVEPEDKEGVGVWVRKDDKLSIGPATVTQIGYLTYKGKLSGVVIIFQGEENYQHIKTTMAATYGAPYVDNEEPYEKTAAWKMANGINLLITINTISNAGKAAYIYQPLNEQRKKDQQEAARRASGDL